MTTSTSLNLRAVLKTALARSGMDQPEGTLSGLTPSAKALFVAGAAQAMPHGAVLYVVPTDADLEQAVADISFFVSAMEGFSQSGADRAILPFPSHEVDPYRGLAPHVGVTSARARALHGLATGTARVVVASAAALLPRVTTPARLIAASIELRPGQDIAPQDLADLLTDAGFTREDPADEHGEFAIRGGIADVFPAGEAQPVRLEFIGDTIETLRTYDPSTQRSIAPIDQVSIVPLRDVLEKDRGATLFDYLALVSEARIVVSEADEVASHALKLGEQIRRGYDEAVGRKERALPPADLVLDWPAIDTRLARATFLSQLGLDGVVEGVVEGAVVQESGRHVRCQPAVEMKGRVADWAADIRRLREDGDTVLFVAMTAGRAERTIELLKEYEIFAIPVERAEDARYAAVLVAVGALSRGFRLPEGSLVGGLQIYAEADVFEEERRAPERRRSAAKAFLSDLRDLKVGDLVVHVDHGIGAFVGLKQIGVGDSMQEFLELRYAGEDKLFVPVERLDSSRSTPGRPSRRSIGSAAPPGSAPKPKSRRPCATWRRSSSSSTRPAAPSRATPSARIPTGRRNSKAPSNMN